jgi:hypothetical protein
MLKNRISSYLETIKFFHKKKDCKVIHFKIPSELFYAYLDYDIISLVSDRISAIANLDLGLIDDDIQKAKGRSDYYWSADNKYYGSEQEQNYFKVKHILKLGWLITDLRQRGVQNPIQLINCGPNKYFCHPGTDRILITTYIEPTDFIQGFYLWYPNIDPNPFILDYEHYEITNPFDFVSMFKFSKSLAIKGVNISKDLDVSDKVVNKSNSQFASAKQCFDKTGKDYDFPFLSFSDKVHWDLIEQFQLLRHTISFQNEKECNLAGIKFTRVKGIWLRESK